MAAKKKAAANKGSAKKRAAKKNRKNGKASGDGSQFEQTFKNIDDVLWKEAGCSSELDYTEQTSWLLFLKYLDDLEQEKAMEAELRGKSILSYLGLAFICFTSAALAFVVLRANAAVAETEWTSDDGRYSAVFPAEPSVIPLHFPQSAVIQYQYVMDSGLVPALYQINVTRAYLLKSRPPEKQIREILEATAEVFAESVGGSKKDLDLHWSTLENAGPRLDHKLTYRRDGTRVKTVGFFVMDGLNVVRVAVAYPILDSDSDTIRRRSFIDSFRIAKTSTVHRSMAQYSNLVAKAAGGKAYDCPPGLVSEMDRGVREQGSKLLGAACFAFRGDSSAVAERIETQQMKLGSGLKRTAWTRSELAGSRQGVLYGDEIIGWWVMPSSAMPAGSYPAGYPTLATVQFMK